MTSNREIVSQYSSPTSPTSSADLIGFAGLTHQQAMDYQYPVAPLEPGYMDGGPYYLGRDTGPWGSARLVTFPPPPPPLSSTPRRRRQPRHPRRAPLSGLASRDRIVDQVALGDPSPVRAQARNALMNRLTNEVRNFSPGCGTSPQLAGFRAMPIRRQLSLRRQYDDFLRSRHSYWEAAAAYVVGDVAAVPCSQCLEGNRMFTQCVVVRRAGGGKQPMAGVCTGCYYGGRGTDCSFHSTFRENGGRAGKVERERAARKNQD